MDRLNRFATLAGFSAALLLAPAAFSQDKQPVGPPKRPGWGAKGGPGKGGPGQPGGGPEGRKMIETMLAEFDKLTPEQKEARLAKMRETVDQLMKEAADLRAQGKFDEAAKKGIEIRMKQRLLGAIREHTKAEAEAKPPEGDKPPAPPDADKPPPPPGSPADKEERMRLREEVRNLRQQLETMRDELNTLRASVDELRDLLRSVAEEPPKGGIAPPAGDKPPPPPPPSGDKPPLPPPPTVPPPPPPGSGVDAK